MFCLVAGAVEKSYNHSIKDRCVQSNSLLRWFHNWDMTIHFSAVKLQWSPICWWIAQPDFRLTGSPVPCMYLDPSKDQKVHPGRHQIPECSSTETKDTHLTDSLLCWVNSAMYRRNIPMQRFIGKEVSSVSFSHFSFPKFYKWTLLFSKSLHVKTFCIISYFNENNALIQGIQILNQRVRCAKNNYFCLAIELNFYSFQDFFPTS